MDNENGLKIIQLTLLGQHEHLSDQTEIYTSLQQFNPVIMYMPNIMNPKMYGYWHIKYIYNMTINRSIIHLHSGRMYEKLWISQIDQQFMFIETTLVA